MKFTVSHPNRFVLTVGLLLTPLLSTWSTDSAAGTIYRCTSAAGVVEYGNSAPRPGQTCEKIALPAITTVPAGPKPAKVATKRKSTNKKSSAGGDGANFPKVGTSTQAKRDEDRARILRDELTREERRLTLLRKEFKNGEPDRRGDERNYQRYLDRVEKMKSDIARSEGNVKSLQRELSASKN